MRIVAAVLKIKDTSSSIVINMSLISKMVQLEPIDSLLSRLNKPVVVNTDDESLDVRIREMLYQAHARPYLMVTHCS